MLWFRRRIYVAWVNWRDPQTFSHRSYALGYFAKKSEAKKKASQPVEWAPKDAIYGFDSIKLS